MINLDGRALEHLQRAPLLSGGRNAVLAGIFSAVFNNRNRRTDKRIYVKRPFFCRADSATAVLRARGKIILESAFTPIELTNRRFRIVSFNIVIRRVI